LCSVEVNTAWASGLVEEGGVTSDLRMLIPTLHTYYCGIFAYP
jgi:hypothetical protein